MRKKYFFRKLLALALLTSLLLNQTDGAGVWATQDGSGEEEPSEESEQEKKSENSVDSAVDDDETEALEQRRQDMLNEIKGIKSDINSVERQIQELKNARSSLQTYISKLDRQVNAIASQMSEMEKKIEEKAKEIEAKETELKEAEAEAQAQYAMMKKRICYMYEQGEQSIFTVFLESENLTEMLNRADYAMQMSSYDRQMMDKLRKIRETIAEKKALLEEEQEAQKELLADLESEKSALDRAIGAKSQEIASYQSQISVAADNQEDYEKQLAEQERLLAEVENQIAAAAAAKAAAADGDGGASGFLWPCPASRRITSGFGPRSAPVPGASTYHKGIDVGAGSGSAIVAAADGRVTTATYSGSAGNYAVISHGNGISTVYMHASALYVSEGQIVSKGQSIAAVGSTGFSSGPHLHFGVIVNGSYVNPLNYVH